MNLYLFCVALNWINLVIKKDVNTYSPAYFTLYYLDSICSSIETVDIAIIYDGQLGCAFLIIFGFLSTNVDESIERCIFNTIFWLDLLYL